MKINGLQRYNMFDKPVILTPGDNEWTDCHRAAAGGCLPMERLAKLREIFYPESGRTIGGRTMQVDTQADVSGDEEFSENVMWTHRRIVFAAMHIVGSQNALAPFAQRTQADDDEVARRWLRQCLLAASQRRSGFR